MVTGSDSERDIFILKSGSLNVARTRRGDDEVSITTVNVGASPSANTLAFTGSDCDSSAEGGQWLCGEEGTDTLKYLAAPRRRQPRLAV